MRLFSPERPVPLPLFAIALLPGSAAPSAKRLPRAGQAAGVLPRDIEPLPLTPEILEKNGWDPITYKIEGAENVHCRPMVVAKDYVVFEVSCGWGAYPVVFVHQLQHLLRLFEIDKEIAL